MKVKPFLASDPREDAAAATPSAVLVYGTHRYIVSIETFDPARAADALRHNTNNRPMSASNVKQLATSITRGEWRLNGETIVFGDTGRLLQGQHRLQAVILSGMSIISLVVRCVPDEVFTTFDRVKKRGAADVLAIDGKKNASMLAAGARAIVFLTKGSYLGKNCSPDQVRETLAKHPTLQKWIDRHSASPARKFLPSSFSGVMTLAAEIHGEPIVDVFVTQVESGERLSRRMPAFTLRERFLNAYRGQVLHSDLALAFFVKAINAHVCGEAMSILRMQSGEAFPSLVGLDQYLEKFA